MKKFTFVLLAYFSAIQFINAQQPMTIAPGLTIDSPTAGTSGLKFNDLNSGTTVSTTPLKVLSLDASGNVILGNAPGTGGGGVLWSVNASSRIEANGGFPNGVEMGRFTSQISTSLASPLINTLGTASTFLRYGRSSTTSAVFQESTTGFTRATSSIFWKYSDESNPQVITNLFGFTGSTNTFSVNGFTQLGEEATTTTSGVTRSSPAIKTILLTGTMPNAVTTIIAVPHGLTASKIIEVRALITGAGGLTVSDNYTPTLSAGGTTYGYLFNTSIDATNINITRNISTTTSSTGLISAAGVTATYKIFVTYIP